VSWGFGNTGQLGIGPTTSTQTSYLPLMIPEFTKRKVVSLSCGISHCAAVVQCQDGSSDNEVFAWGDGSNGKLGTLSDDVCTHIHTHTHTHTHTHKSYGAIASGI
jgi:hypothetical protein